MDLHYRENPWNGPQLTLCGLVPKTVAYTDNQAKVTCVVCLTALKAAAA